MWLFKKRTEGTKEALRERFLDEAAYSAHIQSLAIGSAARVARGGIALQGRDVLTQSEFEREMAALKERVQKTVTP